MLCCDWLWLTFPPKILAIVPEFLLGKDKRVQEVFDARETTCNCVHTSITRESVMIWSTQVLFAEKCRGINAGSEVSGSSKFSIYNTFKSLLTPEEYLSVVNSYFIRRQFTKFRVSDHLLIIEKGRHNGLDRDDGKCRCCDMNCIKD